MPIERELAGGEVDAYQIMLDSGQYLHLVVDQRGIDVVVMVFGPDGQRVAEMDSPKGIQGPESVSVVAETWGIYRVEVRARKAKPAPGRYQVKIGELREVTPRDRRRVAAERTFVEARKLRLQGTKESLRRSIEKYQEARLHWHAVGERSWEALMLNNIGLVYRWLGETQQALEYYHQALPLWQAVEDQREAATTLNNIGAVYFVLGEPQEALDHLRRALRLWRAVTDRGGKPKRSTTSAQSITC